MSYNNESHGDEDENRRDYNERRKAYEEDCADDWKGVPEEWL